MALNKGPYPFPFGTGVDTKTGKQVGNKLLALENGWFAKGGEISKRWGFVSKGVPDAAGKGDNFITLDGELAEATAGKLYSLDSENSAWATKGSIQTAGVTAKSIIQSTADQTNSDVAYVDGITAYAYESNGSVSVVVSDEATGAILATHDLGSGSAPRCAVYQGSIYVFVRATTHINCHVISSATPTQIATSPSVTDCISGTPYAVAYSSGAIFIAFRSQAGPTQIQNFITRSFVVASFAIPTALDLACDPSGNVFLAAAVGNIHFRAYDIQLNALCADITIDSGTLNSIPNITVASSASGAADIYFEVAPSAGDPAYNALTKTVSVNSNGSHGSASTVARSVGLGSRAFWPGSIPRGAAAGTAVALVYDSAVQATYFLWLNGVGIIARFVAGAAGGLQAQPFLSSVVPIGSSKFAAAMATKGPLQSLPGNVLSTTKTASRITFDFDQRYRNVQLGRTVLACGGQIFQYDGDSVVEHGFSVFPEQPKVSSSPGNTFTATQVGGPGGSPPLVIQIEVPADSVGLSDAGSGVASGSMYTPGSYILLPWGGDDTTHDRYIWFSVDGAGTDPAVTATGVEVPLLSTDTQAIVASKISVAIESTLFFTTSSDETSVTVTTKPLSVSGIGGVDPLTIPAPAMEESRFGIWLVNAANEAADTAGYMVGNAELGPRGEFRFLSGETRTVKVDGGVNQSWTYDSTCVDPASAAAFINNAAGSPRVTGAVASVNSEDFSPYDGQLKITSNTTGASSSVVAVPGGTYVHDGFDGGGPVVAGTVAAESSEMYRLTCISGARIQSGQYFTYTSSRYPHTGVKLKYLFYFVVDSVAPDTVPTLPDCVSSVPVNILSTDTASEVATKLNTAMLAVQYTYQGEIGPVTIDVFAAGYILGPAVVMASAATTESLHPQYSSADPPKNYSVGGEMESGQRQYFSVYAWTDAKGLLHRSAPSIGAVSIAAEGNNSTKVTVPTLRLTSKSGVKIEVYRTSAGVDTAQLLKTVDNDPTVDSISFWDSTSDVDLASAEFLYTTGGVLPNVCPPPAQAICAHQNRVFLAGLDDQNLLWYTKKYVDGDGVAFSDLQTIRFDTAGGDITAPATMDDKLIVFKRGRIYFIAGDGPNALGQQDSFSDPQVINTGVGCISPESIVFTPMGLMFQSERGYHLLTRDLQVKDIGAEVDDFVTNSATSAVLMPKSTRVQVTFSSGNAIVYDYFFNQWGTATNHEAQSGVIWNDLYCLIRPDGSVWVESPGTYSDAGASYSLKIQTPWFKPAGVQGFWRCRAFSFLGTFEAPHVINIAVAYDYNDADDRTYTFDPDLAIADGLQMPMGGSLGVGGDGSTVYQFSVQPQRQKCESVRLTITDGATTVGAIPPATTVPLLNSCILSNLEFEVAVKDSNYRFPASRRVG